MANTVATIGGAIKDSRLKRKLSQNELAKLVGVSRVSVAQWEAGKQTPSVASLEKIAQALNATLICGFIIHPESRVLPEAKFAKTE